MLHVATQNGTPTLWALVEREADTFMRRRFVAIGTGHECDSDPGDYLGTCHNVADLGLVFHIFETTRKGSSGG